MSVISKRVGTNCFIYELSSGKSSVCTLYGNLNVISFDDSMVETLMSANEEELHSFDNRIVFAFYPLDVDQTSASDDFDKRIKAYLERCADNS